jgi:hypothetical protein
VAVNANPQADREIFRCANFDVATIGKQFDLSTNSTTADSFLKPSN